MDTRAVGCVSCRHRLLSGIAQKVGKMQVFGQGYAENVQIRGHRSSCKAMGGDIKKKWHLRVFAERDETDLQSNNRDCCCCCQPQQQDEDDPKVERFYFTPAPWFLPLDPIPPRRPGVCRHHSYSSGTSIIPVVRQKMVHLQYFSIGIHIYNSYVHVPGAPPCYVVQRVWSTAIACCSSFLKCIRQQCL